MSEDKTENNGNERLEGSLIRINDKNTTSDTGKHRQVFLLTVVLFLIVFALLSVSTWFLYHRIQDVSLSSSGYAEDAETIGKSVDKRLVNLESELEQLHIQQQEQMDSLTALYQRFPKDNQGWALSEAEYLLVIASHRLLLEKDIKTALTAMDLADLRLKDLGDPTLIPVREQLTADMNALRAVHRVDTSGLAIYLADLIDRSDTLPLKEIRKEAVTRSTDAVQQDQSEAESGWRDLPTIIWNELKSLVVIKRSGETRQALLLPNQEYFLYMNLRLELENARLAVLQRDTENLHGSVSLLLDWLNEYFDTENTSVINVIDTLKKMAGLQLDSEIPDISSSLETLRAYMHEKESSAVLPGLNNRKIYP